MRNIKLSKMIKSFITISLCCVLLSGVWEKPIMATTPITVTYNQNQLSLSSPPRLVGKSVMLPLRDLSQQLGYLVDWESSTGKIEIKEGNYTAILYLGNKEAQVNGKPMTLESAPQIIQGVTYVPLRFIGEAMGMGVDWQAKENTVALEGKYTVDYKTKKLMVRTASGKKVVGDINTYDEHVVDGMNISLTKTKAGSEMVSVNYSIAGALSQTATTTFYIKDGKVIDKLVEEPSVLSTAGILYKNNEVAISTGTEFKVYDDLTGILIKAYNLKEKLGGEGFTPISYSNNYIVGRYENTIHVIDLVSGKATRILDFIPEGTEKEKEAKYYVYPFDMGLTAQDTINLVWETEEALVFKYHDAVENKDKTITYMIGKSNTTLNKN